MCCFTFAGRFSSPSEYERILLGTHATQITAWWDKAVDIIPLACGKGNAVRAVLAHYGFSKAEAIAFGYRWYADI